MSIELYLAVNMLADCALLWAVSRLLGLYHWRRVLGGGTLCAAYALLAACIPRPWSSLPVQIGMLSAVSAIISPRGSPRMRLTVAATIMCAAMVCAGAAVLTSMQRRANAPLGFCLGAMVLVPVFLGRSTAMRNWLVRLRMTQNSKTICFHALIDTGNCLREPLSGLPVLVVEAGLLRELLPERGYRVISYGSLGGKGRLACFKPEGLWIEMRGKLRYAPDLWVAVAPGALPGKYQALAPPEIADCTT